MTTPWPYDRVRLPAERLAHPIGMPSSSSSSHVGTCELASSSSISTCIGLSGNIKEDIRMDMAVGGLTAHAQPFHRFWSMVRIPLGTNLHFVEKPC